MAHPQDHIQSRERRSTTLLRTLKCIRPCSIIDMFCFYTTINVLLVAAWPLTSRVIDPFMSAFIVAVVSTYIVCVRPRWIGYNFPAWCPGRSQGGAGAAQHEHGAGGAEHGAAQAAHGAAQHEHGAARPPAPCGGVLRGFDLFTLHVLAHMAPLVIAAILSNRSQQPLCYTRVAITALFILIYTSVVCPATIYGIHTQELATLAVVAGAAYCWLRRSAAAI